MNLTKKIASLVLPLGVVAACSAGEESPSTSTYTVKFPSTAAAVATDSVQLFTFDFPPEQRTSICLTLIQSRKRQQPLNPTVTGPVVNICELLKGVKPITVPYGEKAVLAVAVRKGADYMLGCTLHTFGDQETDQTRLSVPLSLIDTGQAVPDTPCTSVGDFCNKLCQTN